MTALLSGFPLSSQDHSPLVNMCQTCVMSDGARIGYRVLGTDTTKPTLVMVNGMSAVMQDWQVLAERLARTRRVLLFDHRGIGASYLTEAGDEDITIALMAQDVLDLCKAVGVHDAHLLGFSMGGLITQAILTHPDAKPIDDGTAVRIHSMNVRRVVLASTFARSPRTAFRVDGARVPDGASRDERKRAQVRYMLSMQYHAEVLGEGKPLQKALDERIPLSLSTRRPQEVIMYQAMSVTTYADQAKLAHIPRRLPVAIIHGKRDQMVFYEASDELLGQLPGARRLYPAIDGDREEFGHLWFDYFDIDSAWLAPLTHFLDAPAAHL